MAEFPDFHRPFTAAEAAAVAALDASLAGKVGTGDVNYIDLTDGGATTLHTHAGGSERAAATVAPVAVGTAAVGTSVKDAKEDHVHPTGAGTPSTQAFGDAAAVGTGPAAAMTDHKHAMMVNPVTAHEADTTAIHGITDTAALVLTSDSRLSDARTPSSTLAHAATHIGSTTGEGSAAVVGTDPTTLISYVVRELVVVDEPWILASGTVCILGADNTALVWMDSRAAAVLSTINYIQYQVIVRDEPFVILPNEVIVLGDGSGRTSLWLDSNKQWDRDGEGFSPLLELNADNLFIIAPGDVYEIPSNSPLVRHRTATLVDSGVLWIQ